MEYLAGWEWSTESIQFKRVRGYSVGSGDRGVGEVHAVSPDRIRFSLCSKYLVVVTGNFDQSAEPRCVSCVRIIRERAAVAS